MNFCKHKYFVIYRGDDTDFPGNQELIIELNTERDLTGCSAHFSFQGFTQDFTEIPSDKKLRLVIPNSATGKFALGAADAKLWLTNGTKIRTVENRIHIVVTNRVDEAYNNDDPQAITVTISATVVLDDTVTEESTNGVKSSGIWSWVKSLLPQWLTASYAEPATVESVNGKQPKITASGILKGNGQGGITAATKSSTSADPANADYRDPTDNTCHKTEFTEWTFSGEDYDPTATYEMFFKEIGLASHWELFENGEHLADSQIGATGSDTTVGGFEDYHYENPVNITATRSVVCTDGKKFVTSDVVDGKVSSAVSTNNPAFVSAVRNTPAPEPGQGEDPPWGTWGTVGAAITGLVAGLKWLKDKVFDSAGNIQDQFATDLLGKQVAKETIIYKANTATGLKDRAFNALSLDGTEYNLSTALAAVTPTVENQPRDLLIVATATASTTISFTAGTIKGDKPTIDGSGTWLITLTEYASGVWYCRQIKMEDAA